MQENKSEKNCFSFSFSGHPKRSIGLEMNKQISCNFVARIGMYKYIRIILSNNIVADGVEKKHNDNRNQKCSEEMTRWLKKWKEEKVRKCTKTRDK